MIVLCESTPPINDTTVFVHYVKRRNQLNDTERMNKNSFLVSHRNNLLNDILFQLTFHLYKNENQL
jgi:hypothetical protein